MLATSENGTRRTQEPKPHIVAERSMVWSRLIMKLSTLGNRASALAVAMAHRSPAAFRI